MCVNPRSFTAIRETIAIRIGNADFCMKVVFTNIGQTVFVQIPQGVISERIKAIFHLPAIRHPISIRVDAQGVRLPSDFIAVRQTITVSIIKARIGSCDEDFLIVMQPIAVRVLFQRIRACADTVGQGH